MEQQHHLLGGLGFSLAQAGTVFASSLKLRLLFGPSLEEPTLTSSPTPKDRSC